jgi:hypothetical protein
LHPAVSLVEVSFVIEDLFNEVSQSGLNLLVEGCFDRSIEWAKVIEGGLAYRDLDSCHTEIAGLFKLEIEGVKFIFGTYYF